MFIVLVQSVRHGYVMYIMCVCYGRFGRRLVVRISVPSLTLGHFVHLTNKRLVTCNLESESLGTLTSQSFPFPHHLIDTDRETNSNTQTHTHTHLHTHTYTRTRTHTHAHAHTHTLTHIH